MKSPKYPRPVRPKRRVTKSQVEKLLRLRYPTVVRIVLYRRSHRNPAMGKCWHIRVYWSEKIVSPSRPVGKTLRDAKKTIENELDAMAELECSLEAGKGEDDYGW